jgi:sortase A
LRIRRVVSGLVSLAMIAAGVALIASFFLAGSLNTTATNSEDPRGFNVPKLDTGDGGADSGPEDKTLKLTIPQMARINNATVPDAVGSDEQALKNNAAIHLKGTGFPWQEEANVYLAGHRLGYPNTDSFLAFWDLNVLKEGDQVFLTDADGIRYTYEVFKKAVVGPNDLFVTEPIEGKNIVTLQTCTLPDYSQRLIVQAELVDETDVNAEGEGRVG